MATGRKRSGVGSRRDSREVTLKRMERAAKTVFDLPPLDDQAEWEEELQRELDGESSADESDP